MWTCPVCNREFTRNNQYHSCNEKTLQEFIKGKSIHSIELLEHFINEYKKIGNISVHATKSMISISGKKGVAYIIQLGRNFIDIVFPFKQAFNDNLCFVKIKQVPGSNQYNHHFRMCFAEDINDEVISFMRKALEETG